MPPDSRNGHGRGHGRPCFFVRSRSSSLRQLSTASSSPIRFGDFAELNGRSSLLEGLRHHDYAATRRYWKGDDSLYRPLLFVWLAFANWLFSYHHAWWNAANVVLHGLVVLCLFRLLLTIRSSRFAFGAALLFLVMKPSMELVVWHHLGGYLLACIFLMIGVRAFVQLTGRQERSPSLSVLVTYALAFTTASLFYEAMAVVARWLEGSFSCGNGVNGRSRGVAC